MNAKPRGRRPGPSTSRAAILDAARQEFAAHGYEGATIRSIATAADVDPATIYHHFTDKQALLTAALELPVDEATVAAILPTDRPLDTSALIRGLLTLWQDPTIAERLTAFIRVATNHPEAGTAASDFVHRQLLERLTASIDGDDAQLRAALIISHVAGLAMLRLVIPLQPIRDAGVESLASHLDPLLEQLARPPDAT